VLVAGGEVVTDVDPEAVAESKSTTWRAQQADALVAVMKSYLGGGHGDEGGSTADHYQVVVHADSKAVTGGKGCADLAVDTVKRLLCDCSVVSSPRRPTVTRSTSAASSARCRRR
jgi:hypothetical protein